MYAHIHILCVCSKHTCAHHVSQYVSQKADPAGNNKQPHIHATITTQFSPAPTSRKPMSSLLKRNLDHGLGRDRPLMMRGGCILPRTHSAICTETPQDKSREPRKNRPQHPSSREVRMSWYLIFFCSLF